MCNYELIREQNIQRNNQLLAELGLLGQEACNLSAPKRTYVKRSVTTSKATVRCSPRLRTLDRQKTLRSARRSCRLLQSAAPAEGSEQILSLNDQSTKENLRMCHSKIAHGSVRRGHWSQKEDNKLIELRNSGIVSWTVIAQRIPGRPRKQCKDRWDSYLCVSAQTAPFTSDEKMALFQSHAYLGEKWAEIARLMPGRTEVAVKNEFRAMQKKGFRDTAGRPQSLPADAEFTVGQKVEVMASCDAEVYTPATILKAARDSNGKWTYQVIGDDGKKRQYSVLGSFIRTSTIYVVEKILAHRHSKRGAEFQVLWKGNIGEKTWEPQGNLHPLLVQQFLKTM